MTRRSASVSWACLLSIFGLASLPVEAAEFDIREFAIDIPASFQGPQTSHSPPILETYMFGVRDHAPPIPVFMIVLKTPDVAAPAGAEAGYFLDIARKNAEEMLAAAGRRRTEFRSTEPREILIAGERAVDISWTGMAAELSTHGRIICFATKSGVYLFHVMAAEATIPEHMAAVDAIMKIRRRPKSS